MPTTDEYLNQVLHSYHRDRLPKGSLGKYKDERHKLMQLLQQHYPMHEARVDDLRPSGSYEKKTDINVKFDLDIILAFKHGFKGGIQKAKADLLKVLQEKYKGDHKVKVLNGRVAVCLQIPRGTHTIEIDVVPGEEIGYGRYKQDSADEKDKFLQLYDRVSNATLKTNPHRQIRVVKELGNKGIPPIKLLKIWKHHAKFGIGSYALELMVYNAFKKSFQGKQSPSKLLDHVLASNIEDLRVNKALVEIGSGAAWSDFCKPAAKAQLAAIFAKMRKALEKGDMAALEKYFPMNTIK